MGPTIDSVLKIFRRVFQDQPDFVEPSDWQTRVMEQVRNRVAESPNVPNVSAVGRRDPVQRFMWRLGMSSIAVSCVLQLYIGTVTLTPATSVSTTSVISSGTSEESGSDVYSAVFSPLDITTVLGSN